MLLVAELFGEGTQVHSHPLGFRIAVLPLQRPAEPGEDLGPHQIRRARQAQRRTQVVKLPGEQQLLPEPGAAAEHQGHPFGIIDGVQLGDGRLRQSQAAFRLAGPAGGVGGELEDADVIQAGRAGGFGHPVPQLEHLLEHPQPLRVRQGRPRGARRPPRGRQARSLSCAPRQCSAASTTKVPSGPAREPASSRASSAVAKARCA